MGPYLRFSLCWRSNIIYLTINSGDTSKLDIYLTRLFQTLKLQFAVFGKGKKALIYCSALLDRLSEQTNASNIQLFSDEEWSTILQNPQKSSSEIRTRLVHFKILNRVYWTPAKLHRVGLRQDPAGDFGIPRASLFICYGPAPRLRDGGQQFMRILNWSWVRTFHSYLAYMYWGTLPL